MSRLTARLILRAEREKYRGQMDQLHYLGAVRSQLTATLSYVVEDDKGEWVAQLDWGYAALKNGPRDRWLSWDAFQHKHRLKYVVNNTRFLVLPQGRYIRNLASQSLSLVLKRLSLDWAKYHGHHVYLAETFVDTSRFAGTCYKAANWIYAGQTAGFGRDQDQYFEHGKPKAVYLYPLHEEVKEILAGKEFIHPLLEADNPKDKPMINLNKLPVTGREGLLDAFSNMTDMRGRQGRRYKLSSLLALTVCALLSGCENFQGIFEFGQNLLFDARKRLGFRPFNMPTEPVIRNLLNSIDAYEFDRIVRGWLEQNIPSYRNKAIAIDGKTARASRKDDGKPSHILSAVLHSDGLVIAQREVGDKTNEIPEVRRLLEPLSIEGAVVTMDAMHTQKETAKQIVLSKKADYLLTVKDNQPDLMRKLDDIPDGAFSPSANHSRQSSRKNRETHNSRCSCPIQLSFPLR